MDVNRYQLAHFFDEEIMHDKAALIISYKMRVDKDFELTLFLMIYDDTGSLSLLHLPTNTYTLQLSFNHNINRIDIKDDSLYFYKNSYILPQLHVIIKPHFFVQCRSIICKPPRD